MSTHPLAQVGILDRGARRHERVARICRELARETLTEWLTEQTNVVVELDETGQPDDPKTWQRFWRETGR